MSSFSSLMSPSFQWCVICWAVMILGWFSTSIIASIKKIPDHEDADCRGTLEAAKDWTCKCNFHFCQPASFWSWVVEAESENQCDLHLSSSWYHCAKKTKVGIWLMEVIKKKRGEPSDRWVARREREGGGHSSYLSIKWSGGWAD